jgi:hypothetical protein
MGMTVLNPGGSAKIQRNTAKIYDFFVKLQKL